MMSRFFQECLGFCRILVAYLERFYRVFLRRIILRRLDKNWEYGLYPLMKASFINLGSIIFFSNIIFLPSSFLFFIEAMMESLLCGGILSLWLEEDMLKLMTKELIQEKDVREKEWDAKISKGDIPIYNVPYEDLIVYSWLKFNEDCADRKSTQNLSYLSLLTHRLRDLIT